MKLQAQNVAQVFLIILLSGKKYSPKAEGYATFRNVQVLAEINTGMYVQSL